MRRNALTLLETLTVMGIVALLISMGMAAFGCARHQGQKVTCSANTKSLADAMAVYEYSQGRFAAMFEIKKWRDVNPRSPTSSNMETSNYWFESIDARLVCPARKATSENKDNAAIENYGVNAGVCPTSDGMPLKVTQIKSPSQTFLLADSGFAGVGWENACPAVKTPVYLQKSYVPGLKINTTKLLRSAQKADAITGRHSKAIVNTAFADNHSEAVAASKYQVSGPDISAVWKAR